MQTQPPQALVWAGGWAPDVTFSLNCQVIRMRDPFPGAFPLQGKPAASFPNPGSFLLFSTVWQVETPLHSPWAPFSLFFPYTIRCSETTRHFKHPYLIHHSCSRGSLLLVDSRCLQSLIFVGERGCANICQKKIQTFLCLTTLTENSYTISALMIINLFTREISQGSGLVISFRF